MSPFASTGTARPVPARSLRVGPAAADAAAHLRRLTEIVPGAGGSADVADADGPIAGIDIDAVAAARPDWPVWPQLHLASLVGPPATVPKRLDLTWLHRFGATVAWLDGLVAASGGPDGGPSATSLLVERAALLGHRTWGTTSAGTSCRLVRAADGWIAVNLPRPDDLAAVDAWLGGDGSVEPWALVERAVPERAATELVEVGAMLGLAVAAVPMRGAEPTPGGGGVFIDEQARHRHGDGPWRPAVVTAGAPRAGWARPDGGRPLVVDCSSLWAGPLCGWYLERAGAEVVKVESTRRPDGARAGTPTFWRRLNGAKRLVELDLTSRAGVAELADLVARADVVIEGSRPRAMAGFGIDPRSVVDRGGIWCAITGWGRTGPWAERVAFGDDAAAAGGLVADTPDGPWFIGDAAADPVTGATAAALVLALAHRGLGGIVDIALRDSVATLTDGVPVRCSP